MTTIAELRQAIRPLLNEHDPADALAAYYAFYHADERTRLVIQGNESGRAIGYIAVSRTGIDIFRPLVTLRLPSADLDSGHELITSALPEGSPVILYAPTSYEPLLKALFDMEMNEDHQLLVLDRNYFEPIINVLVTQATSPDGLPRFVIRSQKDPNIVAAAAGLNWQTRYFAEISVQTIADERRQGWGRSVVAAMVQHVLESGRTPLYVCSERNKASLQLADSVGFRDSGQRIIFSPAARKNPF